MKETKKIKDLQSENEKLKVQLENEMSINKDMAKVNMHLQSQVIDFFGEIRGKHTIDGGNLRYI